MEAKIGCFTLGWRKYPFAEALKSIKAAGFGYVGVWPEHEDDAQLDLDAGGGAGAGAGKELAKVIADAGLKPSVLFGRVCPLDDESERKFKLRIDQALELGVDEVLSIAPWPYSKGIDVKRPEAEWAEEVDRFYKHLAPVAKHAEDVGMMLAYKPHTGLTATAVECSALVERAGSPSVKISYDPGNVSYYEGVDPAVDVATIAAETVSVCIKDHVGDRGNPDFPNPGKGEVDFESMFRTLHEHGFTGPATVEKLAGDGPEELAASAAECFEFLNGLIPGI